MSENNLKPLSPYSLAHNSTEVRYYEYKKQAEEQGFDNTEIWNLFVTIAKFLVPRLKVYRRDFMSFPSELTVEEWQEILDKMIEGFELIANDHFELDYKEQLKYRAKEQEAVDLLHKYYFHLWD
jgi:hypothetical protein